VEAGEAGGARTDYELSKSIGRTSGGPAETSELETRIDKYLKENKKKLIIDKEKLTSSLRTSYPEEYGNREKADFKKEVEKAFKEMAAKKSSEMRKKDGESGNGGGKGKGNDYHTCNPYYYGNYYNYYYNYYNYYNNYYYTNCYWGYYWG